MALKQFKKIDKKGHEEIWEWEETPELKAFIKKQSILKLSAPPTRPQQCVIITECFGTPWDGGGIGRRTRLKIC